MLAILSDERKFKRRLKIENIDITEDRIKKHLDLLLNLGFINLQMYNSLKPCGSSHPYIYGLPETHKSGMPLRPILSMNQSPYHKLARWLVDIISPISAKFSRFSLKDHFQLVNYLNDLETVDGLMCSVDVQSLFTNVPLHETVNYIGEIIDSHNLSIPLPTELLKDTILLCTENISFHFFDTPYSQVDGVAMGSPLGPVLADFFMIMIEEKLLNDIRTLQVYKRYVDDTLIVCQSKESLTNFVNKLNACHPNISVTFETEVDCSLPFLDILIIRNEDGSISRRVYRKPTWTGQYLHFTSFAPIKYKRTLVRGLFNRARKIFSADKIDAELVMITNTITLWLPQELHTKTQ